MNLVKLGGTDLEIPSIGMGTGFDFSKTDQKEVLKSLRYGIGFGIKLIDTAEGYGDGIAENLVGKAIKGKRSKIIIASKFSPENSTYKKVIDSCNRSLKKLNTDYIDLYQFHWPNPNVAFEETFSALEVLKQKGKIRFIGLGNFSKQEILKAINITRNKMVVSIQAEYNLFERTIEQNGVLNYCKKNRLSVIAYSPLDQGRIADMSPVQLKLLDLLSKKYSCSTPQILLAWLAKNKNVIAIPRSLKQEHLEENWHSINLKIEKGDILNIDKMFYLPLTLVNTETIMISPHGERDAKAYQTLKEALENKLGFVPSPSELAGQIKDSLILKPVRLIPIKSKFNKFKYELISGRVRYWAWVIAFGTSKPIPAYVRKVIK